jgi:hypothetical protein
MRSLQSRTTNTTMLIGSGLRNADAHAETHDRRNMKSTSCAVSTTDAPYDYYCSFCNRNWVRPTTESYAILAQCFECKGVAVFDKHGELLMESETLDKLGQPRWSVRPFLIGAAIGLIPVVIGWFV